MCPPQGSALIVANHSGVLPIDALMLQVGVLDEHPAHRNLRLLGADLVYSVPLLGRRGQGQRARARQPGRGGAAARRR